MSDLVGVVDLALKCAAAAVAIRIVRSDTALQWAAAAVAVLVVVPQTLALLRSQYLRSARRRMAAATGAKARASVAEFAAALEGKNSNSKEKGKGEGGEDDEQQRASFTLGPIGAVASRARRSRSDAMSLLTDVLHRTVRSNRQLNCVTTFVKPLEALQGEVDDLFSGGGGGSSRRKAGGQQQPPGMLHGLPVSIKECFKIAGQDTTIGVAKKCGLPSADDAVIVKVLRRQGAIVFARTNIPQTMLSYECGNPIYGTTLNPYDLQRSPGGSSGGEGALIGSHGSILGVGTDIGGSCRIPAAYSGCCGFKPTAGRLSGVGAVPGTPGQEGVKSTAGPMAREVDGLVLLYRALLGGGHMHDLDPTVPDMPFDDAKYGLAVPTGDGASGYSNNKRAGGLLRIGWYVDDGFQAPTPACARAVAVAREALEAQGHTLVEWGDVQGFGVDAITFLGMLLGADGLTTIKNVQLKDEDIDPILKPLVFLLGVPYILRQIFCFFMSLLGFTRISVIASKGGASSTSKTWATQNDRKQFVAKVLASWKALEVDAVVCPCTVLPAPHSGSTAALPSMCNYTAFYNLLDAPAGTLPVTYATEADDAELVSSYPRRDPWDKKVVAASAGAGAAGVAVGVQIAALPWEDEKCLRVMKEVELAVNFQPSGGVVGQ